MTYGFTNYFTIVSPYGTFEAEGDYMVRIRIQEIKAIEALQDIKKSKRLRRSSEKGRYEFCQGSMESD